LHLRRAVELAGLVDRCDFTEQHSVTVEGRQLRPDLVVHLPGDRHVVVDAKTPLDAYLDALAIDADLDPDGQHDLLQRHAAQMRRHVHDLSSKAYWSALPGAVDFVVLFVPSESCLSAALESAPGLLEEAARRQVVLASPTTLIALLRTIAHSWTSQSLAEATREIHELGRELHGRLATMGGHLDRLGRSLKASVDAYNATIGSLETRVLVTARQFNDIGVSREALPSPGPVDLTPRPQTAAELLDQLTPQRPEIEAESHEPQSRRGNHDSATGGSTLSA
jgi:DNA recombination protein RmuC